MNTHIQQWINYRLKLLDTYIPMTLHKDILDNIWISLNVHCLICRCDRCRRHHNDCYCYCKTCRTFLRFCKQHYFDSNSMTEADLWKHSNQNWCSLLQAALFRLKQYDRNTQTVWFILEDTVPMTNQLFRGQALHCIKYDGRNNFKMLKGSWRNKLSQLKN